MILLCRSLESNIDFTLSPSSFSVSKTPFSIFSPSVFFKSYLKFPHSCVSCLRVSRKKAYKYLIWNPRKCICSISIPCRRQEYFLSLSLSLLRVYLSCWLRIREDEADTFFVLLRMWLRCLPLLEVQENEEVRQRDQVVLQGNLTWIRREIDTNPWGLLDASVMFL